MAVYLQLAKYLISCFESFEITHVPWAKNAEADKLARIGSRINRDPKSLIRTLFSSLTCESLVINVDEESTWMTPIVNCLKNGELSQDKIKTQALRIKAAHYVYKFG